MAKTRWLKARSLRAYKITLLATVVFTILLVARILGYLVRKYELDAWHGADRVRVFVGILSHPKNVKRRENLRENCFPLYNTTTANPRVAVRYAFLIGRPAEDFSKKQVKVQGTLASHEEIRIGKLVVEESRRYQDIFPVSTAESYVDISDKVMVLFQHGLRERYDLIVKMDDDTCGDVRDIAKQYITREWSETNVYFGYYMFRGDEYESMLGPVYSENSTSVTRSKQPIPYMSGPYYGMTRALAASIFGRERVLASQHQTYATSSEDTAIGALVYMLGHNTVYYDKAKILLKL